MSAANVKLFENYCSCVCVVICRNSPGLIALALLYALALRLVKKAQFMKGGVARASRGWTSACWFTGGFLFPSYHPLEKSMEAVPYPPYGNALYWAYRLLLVELVSEDIVIKNSKKKRRKKEKKCIFLKMERER
ncbi:hypothetical protein TNCV_2383631 [Trichonephila clavipes]|nr:hypothetical protein TNCV_2383631 [Trichonephila clavipes]